MKNYSEALSVIDAKSVYDSVIRNGFSLKQDRRTAIDLAMARETLQHVQATIRLCPHTKMLADSLTKAEVNKGTETQEMQLRKEDPLRKQRDRRTNAALMREVQGYDDDDPEVEQGFPLPWHGWCQLVSSVALVTVMLSDFLV